MQYKEVSMKHLRSLPLKDVAVRDRFWNHYIELVPKTILPFMWELINDRVEGAEKSWCIQNFRIAAGEIQGEYHGAIFQDTDLSKWLEAAAYSLAVHPDPELERTADGAIDLISRAQCEDGYIVTYYIITGKERWSDLMEGHELYSAGHMIEAAVAYYEATGKRKFLDVVCRFADCIDRKFGAEEGKLHGYPGHPEIELALIRLYRVTGEERYLNLAGYFIRERGKQPAIFDQQSPRTDGNYVFPEFRDFDLDYMQADRPLAEQYEAEGHAVRAGYLYSGMADLAGELEDEKLFAQCAALFSDIADRKMYITGGIGSAAYGERFTSAYDLPNDTVYSESCAAISLAMFANRMFRLTGESKYMDTAERALYNTVLSGIALDGKHFFYVNPLEVNPVTSKKNPTMRHIKTERQLWFGCACCPPNIARTLASMAGYMYAQDDDAIYVNLYIQNEADVTFAGGKAHISVDADYPASGHVRVRIDPTETPFAIALRHPGTSGRFDVAADREVLQKEEKDGYLYLTCDWKNGAVIEIDLDADFRYVYANPFVDSDEGKAALMKGPWVYCLEEADNGKHLSGVYADTDAPVLECAVEGLPEGVPGALLRGTRTVAAEGAPLYSFVKPEKEPAEMKAVPYCLWNNRGEGEMAVWMKVK